MAAIAAMIITTAETRRFAGGGAGALTGVVGGVLAGASVVAINHQSAGRSLTTTCNMPGPARQRCGCERISNTEIPTAVLIATNHSNRLGAQVSSDTGTPGVQSWAAGEMPRFVLP
jgi:hypothetical protein